MKRKHPYSIHRGPFLLLSLFLAGACVLGAADQTVIKLWDLHVHDKKFRKDIFKAFNSQNPEIKVEYTSQVATTYITVLDASFRTGSPPDIFMPAGATLSKFVEMGWVIPLDDIAPSSDALRKWMALFPQGQLPFVENTNVFNGNPITHVAASHDSASVGYLYIYCGYNA